MDVKEVTVHVTERVLNELREFALTEFNISIVDDAGLVDMAVNQTIRDLCKLRKMI